MASRIAIMDAGRLQQVGPPQSVYERPFNLFVARFIGSPPMNTIDATVATEAGETWADLGAAGRLRLGPATAPLVAGASIVVGVRPEYLQVGAARLGAITASVRTIEWLGHERHVICDVAGQTVIVRQPTEGTAPTAGDVVALTTAVEHVHLFDAATTERLN